MTVKEILSAQKCCFAAGNTLAPAVRKQYLKNLLLEVRKREKEICAALYEDLHKSEFEARTTETGIILDELSTMIRKLGSYVRPRKAGVSSLNFPAKGRIYPEPYGNVLIFSAWNYPFQLLFSPFIGACRRQLRHSSSPAEQAPATAEIAAKIVAAVFPPEYASVCNGGHEMTQELLAEEFDCIFYTGGSAGAKFIARAAAEHFTPLTLELGGKSPCIVDADAKIDLAAKRIVWGKFLNAGQTCVAPDYLLVHKTARDKLLDRLRHWIRTFYGDNPKNSPDYPRIINAHHCERIAGLINGSEIFCGGGIDLEEKYIEPTILIPAGPDAPVMNEEIFGPLLPVLEVESLDEAITFVNKRPKPLALYYFSDGLRELEKLLTRTSSGGVAVNETITHLINPELPFGGVGASGYGAYHGRKTFDTFTHYKSVMIKSNLIDLPLRYPPNLNRNLKILDFISK